MTNHHKIRIHIDQKPYESPTPIIGEALYVLGNVPAGLELYWEVTGNREDQPIENGTEIVHKEDEHLHSGPPKTYRIIINGEQKEVVTKTVPFAEIVKLAYPTPPTGDNILWFWCKRVETDGGLR